MRIASSPRVWAPAGSFREQKYAVAVEAYFHGREIVVTITSAMQEIFINVKKKAN
jgi:hypothetical protein